MDAPESGARVHSEATSPGPQLIAIGVRERQPISSIGRQCLSRLRPPLFLSNQTVLST